VASPPSIIAVGASGAQASHGRHPAFPFVLAVLWYPTESPMKNHLSRVSGRGRRRSRRVRAKSRGVGGGTTGRQAGGRASRRAWRAPKSCPLVLARWRTPQPVAPTASLRASALVGGPSPAPARERRSTSLVDSDTTVLLGVSAARLGQPVMVDRYAQRDRGVQVHAQDLGHRAELLLHFRIKPDGVPEATALVIHIGFRAVLGPARLLRSTCVAIYSGTSFGHHR
jgi:hypothetical protein